MEKDILERLRVLEREGRAALAAARKRKVQERSKKQHSLIMDEFLRARKSGTVDETYLLTKYLDRDDLTVEVRHALTRRRRLLLRKSESRS